MTKKSLIGFTMIELLVVATIIIVLTTIGMVSFQSANQKGRNAKRKADLESVRQALVLRRADIGEYPDDGTPFDTVVSTLNTGGYLSTPTVTDPKGFDYTYSGGTTFSLGATLEPVDENPENPYSVSSP